MLGSAQVRACFAEKTLLCGKGFLAKMLRSAQVRAEFAEEIVVRARFLG